MLQWRCAVPNVREVRICVLVGPWPRISTTFIAQELVGLEESGLRLWLAALEPGDEMRHSLHNDLRAQVFHLPAEASLLRPGLPTRFWLGYLKALCVLLVDLAKGGWRRKLDLFVKATRVAAEMPNDTELLYFHFIDKPGKLGRYLAIITGLPLVGSAHARDVWVTPEHEQRQVLKHVRWIATCNRPAADRLRALANDPAKVLLIYHGLAFERFPQEPPVRDEADGSGSRRPVEILSVGRAVEKKGFDVLLDALSMLPADLNWRWNHVGDGKILVSLKKRSEALGLSAKVSWHGAQTQDEVIGRYRQSDLFVLPSRAAADNDQDGLPNVLMEAQSQALPCISTNFSAIPDLIENGQTGVLVPPGDAAALAASIEQMVRSPARRRQIGLAGYERVRRDFRAETGIQELAACLANTSS